MRKPKLGCVIGSVLLAVLCVWLAWAFEQDYGAYGSVRRTNCLSNLRHIGQATKLYASDFDDRFVPAAKWMECLTPYLNTEGALHCPCLPAKKKTKSNYGYAFNSDLSGKEVFEIKEPDRAPLAYESSNWQKNAADAFTSFTGPFDPAVRESRRANIAYVSGRVERAVKKD